ncbi:hypothetical protein M513_11223 [Trichuris suis]|uniref:FLYWCH-type domain-containing protein n=1 Tax=Trichuris suis TaxID=68888 RepID=A0A085LSI6_9BILA|nr:hypothetical protein M513_11223 [Trichuris suis]
MATSNYVMSAKNREKFVHEGHMHTYDRLNSSRTIKFWRCDKRYMYRCKARLHTRVDTGEVVRMLNDHNHDSDCSRCGNISSQCCHAPSRSHDGNASGNYTQFSYNAFFAHTRF